MTMGPPTILPPTEDHSASFISASSGSLSLSVYQDLTSALPTHQSFIKHIEQTADTPTGIQLLKTLNFDRTPKWMQVDPYIRYGYRPQLDSFLLSISSLFYLHNELVNTWTHLIPAVLYASLLLNTTSGLFVKDHVSATDVFVIQIYILGTSICLFLSVNYFHCPLLYITLF